MHLKIPGEEPEGEPRKLKESHTAGSLTHAIVFQERGGPEKKLLEHSLGTVAWLSTEPRLELLGVPIWKLPDMQNISATLSTS